MREVCLRGEARDDDRQAFEAIGRALYDLCVPPPLRPMLREGAGGHLWLRLRGWTVEVPWEWMHDGEAAWASRYSLGREVPVAPGARFVAAEPPACPAQTVVLGDPAGDLPEARAEVDVVHRALRATGLRPRTRAGELLADDLRVTFRAADVVHLAAHLDPPTVAPDLSSDPSGGGWGIRCVDGHLRAEDLTAMGGTTPFPALVVLNCCTSDVLAPALLAAGTGHVVATATVIPDAVARDLAASMYAALARGASLGAALREAREAADPLLTAPWLLYGDPSVDLAQGFPAAAAEAGVRGVAGDGGLGATLAVCMQHDRAIDGTTSSGVDRRVAELGTNLEERLRGWGVAPERAGDVVLARVPLERFGDGYADAALVMAQRLVESDPAGDLVDWKGGRLVRLGVGVAASGPRSVEHGRWLAALARPDAPLVDDRIRALSRHTGAAWTRHPAPVAGERRVWRVTFDRTDLDVLPELLGREGTLARLASVLEETVDAGTPQLALLTGPAGCGKTALLRTLEAELAARGLPVVCCRAAALGEYRVWASERGPAPARAPGEADPGPVCALVAHSLPPDADGPGEDPWAWAEALRGDGTTVWLIDGAERLHASFVTDLERLLDELDERPLCVVAALRADRPEDRARADRLAARAPGGTIPVPPLRANDARLLLRRRLGVDTLPAELEPLVETAAGNPLVLVRGLEHLQQQGVLRRPGRGLLVDPEKIGSVGPSPMEEALVAARVAELAPDVRAVVEGVAIFGGDAPTEALDALPSVEAGAFRRAVSGGWLRLRSTRTWQGREMRASLRDPLIARVLPHLVPPSRSRPLHDAALAWLEATGAPPSDRAHHALRSSAPLQAVVPLWEEALGCRDGGNFDGVLAALDPLERLLATSPESDLPVGTPPPGAMRALRDAAERLVAQDSDSTEFEEAKTLFDSSTGFEPVEGRTIGRYTAVRVLAVGSTGTVYLAEQDGPEGFRRRVALKVLHRQLAQNGAFLHAFQREARIAARLSHPNVVAVTDLGQVGDEWYLAMDYVSGCSVRRLIQACPEGMPADIALTIGAGVAAGLAHAHTSQTAPVVHRDVCPENVIVDRDGIPRVFDFGLARAADTVGPPTETGALRGRASYVPPERLEEGEIGPAADLWSLAAMLFELLTGDKLFDGRTILDVLDAICLGDLEAPLERIDSLDAELGGWLRQMLVRDPGLRAADAGQAAEALERIAMRLRPFEDAPRRRLAALVGDVARDEVD